MFTLRVALLISVGGVLAELPRVKVNEQHLFEDSDGRIRIFHGTSFVDKGFDLVRVSDEQMDIFARKWGMNFARVGILWDLVEPKPGVYNQTYLGLLKDLVNRFHKYGVYTMIDMHQDVWARQYCGHGFPNFYSHPDHDPLYMKDGILAFPSPIAKPVYANDSKGDFPPIKNCDALDESSLGWISGYVTFALASGVQRLYDNADGYANKFGDFWYQIAALLANDTNNVGYELINEPWMGNVWKNPKLFIPGVGDRENMQRLYELLHKRIREADDDGVIFYESGYAGNFFDLAGFTEGVGGDAYKDRRAFSYHLYCPMLQADLNNNGSVWHFIYEALGWSINMDCNIAFSVGITSRQRDIQRLGGGGLMTEFGALPSDLKMGVPSTNYLMKRMDELFSGWVYWLIVPSADHNPDEVKLLARPYPRAISGQPLKLSYDPDSRIFNLAYKPSNRTKTFQLPTEIFVSKEITYPQGFQIDITPAVTTHTYNENTSLLQVYHRDAAKATDILTITITSK